MSATKHTRYRNNWIANPIPLAEGQHLCPYCKLVVPTKNHLTYCNAVGFALQSGARYAVKGGANLVGSSPTKDKHD